MSLFIQIFAKSNEKLTKICKSMQKFVNSLQHFIKQFFINELLVNEINKSLQTKH